MEFTGDFYGVTPPPGLDPGTTGVARGDARVRTARCDSGKLHFVATWRGIDLSLVS